MMMVEVKGTFTNHVIEIEKKRINKDIKKYKRIKEGKSKVKHPQDQLLTLYSQIKTGKRRLEVMVENKISNKTLYRFAYYLEEFDRRMLINVVNHPVGGWTLEGITPREVPRLRTLGDLQLLTLCETAAFPTGLGFDVVEWIRTEGLGRLQDLTPVTRQERKSLFSPEQIKKIIQRVGTALRDIKENGEDPSKMIEVGIPEQGISYRVFKAKQPLAKFLKAIGCHEPKATRRTKRPTFIPGEFLQ